MEQTTTTTATRNNNTTYSNLYTNDNDLLLLNCGTTKQLPSQLLQQQHQRDEQLSIMAKYTHDTHNKLLLDNKDNIGRNAIMKSNQLGGMVGTTFNRKQFFSTQDNNKSKKSPDVTTAGTVSCYNTPSINIQQQQQHDIDYTIGFTGITETCSFIIDPIRVESHPFEQQQQQRQQDMVYSSERSSAISTRRMNTEEIETKTDDVATSTVLDETNIETAKDEKTFEMLLQLYETRKGAFE
jgi:hypothetical protein